MIAHDLYKHLYDWAVKILNTDRPTLDVTPIIKSHQNAPAPTEKPYIVIARSPVRRAIGQPALGGLKEDNHSADLRQDYEMLVEIWEVNGDGDLLQLLLDSLHKQSIQTIWTTAGFAFLGLMTGIQPLNVLEGKLWRLESMMEMRVGMIDLTEDSDINKIEQVEMIGTIPPQGGSGDHIIP